MASTSVCLNCNARYVPQGFNIKHCPDCVRMRKAQKRSDNAAAAARADQRAAEAAAQQRAAAAERARREAAEKAAKKARIDAAHAAETARLQAWVREAVVQMPTDNKECPDCAETIKAKAKVCKHCGFRFEGVAEQLAAEEAKAVASLRAAQDKGEAMVLAESHSLVDFTLRSMICQRIMPSEKAAGLLLIWREKPAQMQEHIEAYQSNAEGEIDRLMQPAVRPIEDLANSATLVFRTRVAGGSGHIDPCLEFDPAPVAAYSEDGDVEDSDEEGIEIGTELAKGKTQSLRMGIPKLLTWSEGLDGGHHVRTFEVMVASGKLDLTLCSLNQRLNDGPKVTESLELAPFDVVEIDLDWKMDVSMFQSLVAGYRVRSAKRRAGTETSHHARWVKRLLDASLYGAILAQSRADFEARATLLHEVQTLQPLAEAIADASIDTGTEPQRLSLPKLEVGDLPPDDLDNLGSVEAVNKGKLSTGLDNWTQKAELERVLRKHKKELQQLILSLPEDAAPVCAAIAEARKSAADEEVEARAHWELATGVQQEWQEASAAVPAAEKRVAEARRTVDGQSGPLAKLAMEAWLAGELDDIEVFSTVKTLKAECDELRARSEELQKVKGFFAQAKAMAEQVPIQAKLAVAETQFHTEKKKIGRALIVANEEQLALCDRTREVVEAITAARQQIVDAQAGLESATAERDARIPEWAERLGLDSVDAAIIKSEVASRLAVQHKAAAAIRKFDELSVVTLTLAAESDDLPDHAEIRTLVATIKEKEEAHAALN